MEKVTTTELNIGLTYATLTMLAFEVVQPACARQIGTNISIFCGNIALYSALNKS
jgi:hypothetical protein